MSPGVHTIEVLGFEEGFDCSSTAQGMSLQYLSPERPNFIPISGTPGFCAR
jgi:hypothetical protein